MAQRRDATEADFRADAELYYEHCLKIVPKQGGQVIPLRLKNEQRRLKAAIDHERRRGRPPRIVVLKSRKIGASTLTEAELFRDCHLNPYRQALVMAHELDSTAAIFTMAQRFYDNLPAGMKPPRKYATKKLIHFDHNDSIMQVVVAGDPRGYTPQTLHISEAAFIKDAETIMSAILPAVGKDVSTLVVVESTPNGQGNYFHNLWTNAVAGRNEWVPFFSPWFSDEDAVMHPWPGLKPETMNEHDAKLMRDHSLSLEQMAWYIWTRENVFNGDQRKMDQENASDPRSCFLASGSMVFDVGLEKYLDAKDVAVAEGSIPPQCEVEENPTDKRGPNIRIVERGRWRIYRPPVPRHLYVAGIDTGSGEPNGDYTPITVLNRHTLGVDAVFYSRLPPHLQAPMAALIGYWYNTAKIIGDQNNHGGQFFDELIRNLRYPNVYYRLVDEKSVAGKVSPRPGLWINEYNRTPLFNLARRFIRDGAGVCLDPDILKEMSEMFYDESHRADHPKGGFSDGVSALSCALYYHCGTFEGTLEPLPLETLSKAATLYRENAVRRSMGLPEQDIDLAQLTMDQIEAMDRAQARRRESRERSGLGGLR